MKGKLLETFQATRLASQEEFDRVMMEINLEQSDETNWLRRKLDDCTLAANNTRFEIYKLKMKIATIQVERAEIEKTLRDINREYHRLKHELIEHNPIGSWEKKEGDNGTQTETD